MGKVAHAERPAAPPVRKLSYRIDEAVTATGLSRPTIYRLIERGEIKAIRNGSPRGMRLILAQDLDAFRERLRRGTVDTSEPPIEPVAPPFPVCGVYLLFVGDELAYVGRSKSIRTRLAGHRRDERHFDRYEVIACDEAASVWLEKELIRTLHPQQNLLRYVRHTEATTRQLEALSRG